MFAVFTARRTAGIDSKSSVCLSVTLR